MTYNVFSGTLNPAQSIDQLYSNNMDIFLKQLIQFYLNNATNLCHSTLCGPTTETVL